MLGLEGIILDLDKRMLGLNMSVMGIFLEILSLLGGILLGLRVRRVGANIFRGQTRGGRVRVQDRDDVIITTYCEFKVFYSDDDNWMATPTNNISSSSESELDEDRLSMDSSTCESISPNKPATSMDVNSNYP